MPLSSARIRVTLNTLAVGSLLSCSDATSPSRPEILATVPVAGRGGSPPASASVQFWLYTHSFPWDPGSASLFRSRTIREGDEGNTLVANAENESGFTAFAALVTNGVDELVGYLVGATGGGGGSITMLESRFFVGKPGTGPDLSGYAVDSVQLVIDAVSIASPGSDPNHDGIWTDYDFAGRVLVWGHRWFWLEYAPRCLRMVKLLAVERWFFERYATDRVSASNFQATAIGQATGPAVANLAKKIVEQRSSFWQS